MMLMLVIKIKILLLQPFLQPSDSACLHRHLLRYLRTRSYQHQNMGLGDIKILEIILEVFFQNPGWSIERGGHLLFRFLSLLFSSSSPSFPDRHGHSHSDIQVDFAKTKTWKTLKTTQIQPGPLHCSLPPLLGLHWPGFRKQMTKKNNFGLLGLRRINLVSEWPNVFKNNYVQGCFAAFIRGPKRKSMIVYFVCILVPSAIYSLPHFFEHKVICDISVILDTCTKLTFLNIR